MFRELAARRPVMHTRGGERRARDGLAGVVDHGLQRTGSGRDRAARHEHLGGCDAIVAEDAERALRAPDGHLADAALGDRPAVDLDELVDEAGGGMTRPGDEPGTDAVRVDRSAAARIAFEARDLVFIEVTGHDDPRRGRAELVEPDARPAGLLGRIARVESHGAGPGETEIVGGAHRGSQSGIRVEGIDEQRRVGTERFELRDERGILAVVSQGVHVRGRADGRDPVAPPRLEVRRGRESGDVRGARAASTAASSCVRRPPMSTSGARASAAVTIRAAADATALS